MYNKIAQKVENNGWASKNDIEAIEKLTTKNFALITDEFVKILLNHTDYCKVYQVGTPLISTFFGIGMQKSKIYYIL